MARPTVLHLPLSGPRGEPVDLWRTLLSHGLASLPPNRIDHATRTLTTTLAVPGAQPVALRIGRSPQATAQVTLSRPLPPSGREAVGDTVRRMLRLDQDLSGFYALAAFDPALAWVTTGAGRMLRAPTVFEDVVKTICTTNCAWSATVRMVSALVTGLGERVSADATAGPAFPTPAAMAAAPESFYRDEARAGYRGRYLRLLAEEVAADRLDLEALAVPEPDGLPEEEVRRRLLALPGVGPYAAAHVMLLIGRCRPLVLDSWTRPTFTRLRGEYLPDAEIESRFATYGSFAGLAFWLWLTRDWVPDDPG